MTWKRPCIKGGPILWELFDDAAPWPRIRGFISKRIEKPRFRYDVWAPGAVRSSSGYVASVVRAKREVETWLASNVWAERRAAS